MNTFEPIDNEKFAQIAGVHFDQEEIIPGPFVYSRTHEVHQYFDDLAEVGPCVLITSFSDEPVWPDIAEQLPGNVHRWYSTNVMTDNPRVSPIPIGFQYNVDKTQLLMRKIEDGRLGLKNLLYLCFDRLTPREPNPREGLYELFGRHPWVTLEGGLEPISWMDYYDGIRSHQFVLSPPGAGPDCHRTWEAMALGSIPIVLRNKASEILDGMPALLIDHWDDVTLSKLEAEWENLSPLFDSPEAMKKLDMKYWRRVICSN